MVKFCEMSKYDQHEMASICYDSICSASTIKDLEVVGKLIKAWDPDDKTRSVLKIAYLKKLKELKCKT